MQTTRSWLIFSDNKKPYSGGYRLGILKYSTCGSRESKNIEHERREDVISDVLIWQFELLEALRSLRKGPLTCAVTLKNHTKSWLSEVLLYKTTSETNIVTVWVCSQLALTVQRLQGGFWWRGLNHCFLSHDDLKKLLVHNKHMWTGYS